jgi:hypothetical protein
MRIEYIIMPCDPPDHITYQLNRLRILASLKSMMAASSTEAEYVPTAFAV